MMCFSIKNDFTQFLAKKFANNILGQPIERLTKVSAPCVIQYFMTPIEMVGDKSEINFEFM